MAWTIGVDVGGTFTDFYAADDASGRVVVAKRSSTPDDPSRAILDGLDELESRHGVPLSTVRRFAHGTTVATNALIQRRGGKVALITTRGFADLLEIGRQKRPHMYDLHRDFPPPLAPAERRLEVAERVTADGSVLRPLDMAEVDAAVDAVRASGAEACAVCFLFAFLNPAHERAVAERLRAALPDLHISLSSEVQPEFREYERFTTTTINAYLQPVMARYVERLEAGLGLRLPQAHVGINQSGGGLMSPGRARTLPVRTALSGPAAGIVGAIAVADSAGHRDAITLDMGGTSADVALIRAGAADMAPEREVAELPIRLPMVDIATVGAGGGSIAWIDRDGLLKVGPTSAGADPGPACYGRGGEHPTVSDANLLLGRLSPRGLLGGAMQLDRDLSERALAPLAARLGLGLTRAARGVVDIVVATMVRAIRTVSVERGHDPRDFVLLPFGGAGPLHARAVARDLGIGTIVVPPAPGIVCAQGLVVSDLKEDFVASRRTPIDERKINMLKGDITSLLEQAGAWFTAEEIRPERQRLALALDLRYVGQNFELTVPVAEGPSLAPDDLPDPAALRALFFAAHEAAYGFHNPRDPVEAMSVRLVARGRLDRPGPPPQAPPAAERPAAREERPVVFDADEPLATPVYERADLLPGHTLTGPAVVEQLDATTLLFPGDRARVDAAHNLIVEVAQ